MTTAQKRRLESGTKLAAAHRSFVLERKQAADSATPGVPGLDVEARTLTLTFSSEAPVDRWFGAEVLSHATGAADLTRLNDGAPLLFNHNMDDVIGVVQTAALGADRKGHAVVRFANTARASEVMDMVADGILRNVSFMYQATKYQIDSTEDDPYYDPDATYTATSWMAFEISIVSVPADQTVGVGRALNVEAQSVEVLAPVRSAIPAAIAEPQLSGENMKFRRHLVQNAVDAQGSSGGGSAALVAAQTATPVDLVAVERQRVEDIVALSRRHNVPWETTQDMIAKGTDIAAARGIVLERLFAANPQAPVASLGNNPNPDMTDKEKRSWSLLRAVSAAINKDWGKAGFEREVSDEIAKRTGKQATTGFFMPTNLPFAPSEDHLRAWRLMGGGAQMRAPYVAGTAGQGGNLVATNLLADQWIEVLRNQLVTTMLGARYLTGLVGNVDIPRQITATGTYWVGESGAPTESEATFDKVSLRPKTIGAMSKISRLMLLQGTPAIEMIAREDLMAVMALGIDLASISGSGSSNQPTGIVNQSGVSSVVGGTNGLALSFDHIIQLQYATKFANAPQGAAGYALNSKAIGYLSTLKASTGQYLWDPAGGLTNSSPDKLKGRVYAESQQLRSTLTKGSASGICSELVYGNWRELLIGEWGVTEIMVNPYGTTTTEFGAGDIWLRALQTMDIGVRHGASFSVMSDALTPGF
jgi:HK97 family phage major capsid protein/HK97 family phage prohead protease